MKNMKHKIFFLMIMSFLISLFIFTGCDDDSTSSQNDEQSVTIEQIFPLSVGNLWNYANTDSTLNDGIYEVETYTTTTEVTEALEHLGQSSFLFHIIEDGEEEDLYYYYAGNLLYEAEPGDTEWSWEEDIQGFTDKEVGYVFFSEDETSIEDDLNLRETDELSIYSFDGTVGDYTECIVFMEEKYDIFTDDNGDFVMGEHSIEYTYFAIGIGIVKSVDNDWEMIDETTDGALLQFEQIVLTSTTLE
jgi:hypothetical protein